MMQELIQLIPIDEWILKNTFCDLAKTHRQLFCEFYSSLFQESIADLLADGERPKASELMFEQMMRDILGGGECETALEQASYALGYNLAIEYLAQVEKGTMLDSFRVLDKKIFAAKGLSVEWTFLEIHAIGMPILLKIVSIDYNVELNCFYKAKK